MITISETKNKYARRAYILAMNLVMIIMMTVSVPLFVLAGIVDGVIEGASRCYHRLKEFPDMFRDSWGLW